MKYHVVIDYFTGQDVDVLVDAFSVHQSILKTETGGEIIFYPLFEVRTVTVVVDNG